MCASLDAILLNKVYSTDADRTVYTSCTENKLGLSRDKRRTCSSY
jgi:hypothetical protein